MTDTRIGARQERRARRLFHRGRASRPRYESGVILLSALLFWFILRAPLSAAEAARNGLALSVHSVLPSLFPFLVLASLFMESSIVRRIGRRVSPVTEALFGISGEGAGALLLGLFCGFPIGARAVMGAYERGSLSKEEAERLLPLANGPSFAFLFSAVGCGLFESPAFGLSLYFSSVAASLLCGILLRLLFGKCEGAVGCEGSSPPEALPTLFVRAVTDAGGASVSVTAFIVFFSILSDALSALLLSLRAPEFLSLLLSGLLELSSGTKKAAETVSGLCGRIVCGFFAGWGGLCAHLQVIATVERPLPDRARRNTPSFRSYFLCKVLIGLFTAALVSIPAAL